MELILFASALLAAPQTAPAPAVPAASQAAARFTLDTPIEDIAADAKGKAVLDATLPGLTTHPMYNQFKGMSLREVAPMSGGKMTEQAMVRTQTALAAIR